MFEVDRRLHSFIKVQRAADLEVEQRLKAALRQLCLVGCVLGGPGGRAGMIVRRRGLWVRVGISFFNKEGIETGNWKS